MKSLHLHGGNGGRTGVFPAVHKIANDCFLKRVASWEGVPSLPFVEPRVKFRGEVVHRWNRRHFATAYPNPHSNRGPRR